MSSREATIRSFRARSVKVVWDGAAPPSVEALQAAFAPFGAISTVRVKQRTALVLYRDARSVASAVDGTRGPWIATAVATERADPRRGSPSAPFGQAPAAEAFSGAPSGQAPAAEVPAKAPSGLSFKMAARAAALRARARAQLREQAREEGDSEGGDPVAAALRFVGGDDVEEAIEAYKARSELLDAADELLDPANAQVHLHDAWEQRCVDAQV